MKHDMNRRMLLKSENHILRRYRMGFFVLTAVLFGTYIYIDRKNANKKTNLKTDLNMMKEKSQKIKDPGI